MMVGCARVPVSDPARDELLRHIHGAYLFHVDVARLELLSVPEIVARLDPDTQLVEVRRRMSTDFIRGFEPEGSVVDVRSLGGGRGYLRLVFFGRQTLKDLRRALNEFLRPLCALTIDLRDNAGGNFDQALRIAELFLPLGAPLTIYEGREGRALLYATGTAAPRQERLTLLINARTASSAELFAGVLRWHHRAELVGTPTTGKHTVQQVVRLDQAHLRSRRRAGSWHLMDPRLVSPGRDRIVPLRGMTWNASRHHAPTRYPQSGDGDKKTPTVVA